MISSRKWILPMILLLSCSKLDKEKSIVIAEVGQETIRLDEFQKQYRDFLDRTGIKDNLLFDFSLKYRPNPADKFRDIFFFITK